MAGRAAASTSPSRRPSRPGVRHHHRSDDVPDGLDDVCRPALVAELLDRGWREDDPVRLIGGNVRAFREVEAVARSTSARRGPSTATVEDLDRA